MRRFYFTLCMMAVSCATNPEDSLEKGILGKWAGTYPDTLQNTSFTVSVEMEYKSDSSFKHTENIDSMNYVKNQGRWHIQGDTLIRNPDKCEIADLTASNNRIQVGTAKTKNCLGPDTNVIDIKDGILNFKFMNNGKAHSVDFGRK